MLWYHDHAMGINRLNVYAGLFGVVILRDKFEDALNLPSGNYEIPLTIFDRLITPDGQLYYPISDHPRAPWIPELFGDAVTDQRQAVCFPYLDVEPRKYRFRILNAAERAASTICRLSKRSKLPIYQIGTDQGLLPAPASLKATQLAPGERADIIVDFTDSRGAADLCAERTTQTESHAVPRARRIKSATAVPCRKNCVRSQRSPNRRRRKLVCSLSTNIAASPVTPPCCFSTPATGTIPSPRSPPSTAPRSGASSTLPTTRIRFICTRCASRFSIVSTTRPWTYSNQAAIPLPRPTRPARALRSRMEGHRRRALQDGHPHHRSASMPMRASYVWHCHILEHEDNEMMRPYEIVAG